MSFHFVEGFFLPCGPAPFLPLRKSFFFCPADLDFSFSFHFVKLFLAPRVRAGLALALPPQVGSSWASSPALRPACACDPTARPAVRTLGVGMRPPRPGRGGTSAPGTRTLRCHRSCGPRRELAITLPFAKDLHSLFALPGSWSEGRLGVAGGGSYPRPLG